MLVLRVIFAEMIGVGMALSSSRLLGGRAEIVNSLSVSRMSSNWDRPDKQSTSNLTTIL